MAVPEPQPELDLRECLHDRLGGDGLAHLAGLPHLRRLDLSRCKLIDRHLALLTGAPRLTWLSLRFSTGLTRQGLAHLDRLPALQVLEAPTNTQDRLLELQRLLPGCEVA